jgi:DNA-binding NtrC family response regulator
VDPKTILLLVADRERRTLLGDALRLESHAVLVAENVDEAIVVADTATRPVDLVVTDQRLDEGAGQGVAAVIARRQPDARVLYLMGFGAYGVRLPMYYLDGDASPSAVARVATRLLVRP